MRGQANWNEHARFMNGLTASGFIRLGGPLTDTLDIFLVVEAETEQQVRETLQRDPWEPAGILTTGDIKQWTVMLDSHQK